MEALEGGLSEATTFPRRHREEFAPDPDIVRECETLLAQAKSGQLRAFAVALVFHDGLIPSGEVNRAWVTTPGTAWALDTSISRLVHKWRRHEYDGDSQQAQVSP
jgi:hypothetical protein